MYDGKLKPVSHEKIRVFRGFRIALTVLLLLDSLVGVSTIMPRIDARHCAGMVRHGQTI